MKPVRAEDLGDVAQDTMQFLHDRGVQLDAVPQLCAHLFQMSVEQKSEREREFVLYARVSHDPAAARRRAMLERKVWLTNEEAADYVGMTVEALMTRKKRGGVVAHKTGSAKNSPLRWLREDLDAMMKREARGARRGPIPTGEMLDRRKNGGNGALRRAKSPVRGVGAENERP